jgi:hypothetical protein
VINEKNKGNPAENAMSPIKSNESDDLEVVCGADAIAQLIDPKLYKTNPVKARRRVYHLGADAKGNKPPIFQIGTLLCLRPSALREYYARLERDATERKAR